MGNDDSDQSISEEEDLCGDGSENWISLGNPKEQKGRSEILSQLELLRDTEECGSGVKTINSLRMRNDFCHDDDIEFPSFENVDHSVHVPEMAPVPILKEQTFCFPKAASLSISDEEIISDDDIEPARQVGVPYGSTYRYEVGGPWREAKELVDSSRRPGCSLHCTLAKPNNAYKGGRGKDRLSSSFCLQTHSESQPFLLKPEKEISMLMVAQPTEEFDASRQNKGNNSMADLLEDYNEKEAPSAIPEDPVDEVVQLAPIQHSMAEFLDCFQERSGLPQSNLKMHRGAKRKSRLVAKRSSSTLAKRNMDSDFETEALDGGKSSSDEGDNENLRPIIPAKTMAEQFQAVLGSENDGPLRASPRQLGSGLSGKLQRVIQREKEMEIHFLSKLHSDGCSEGDSHSIDVKIVSRSLEAKLTVCTCAMVGDEENFRRVNECEGTTKSGRTSVIIFSSKTCHDVELEVGNLIRIHAPWKEVPVKGHHGAIILSSYFSKIPT